MIITSEDGKDYYFERNVIRVIYKTTIGGKVKDRFSKPQNWHFMVYHNDAIQVFYEADSYYFNKNNELISKASSGSQIVVIPVLFKRPGEDIPTYITELLKGGIEIGKNKAFRNMAVLYFENDPEFVNRIENKEFKAYGFIELAQAYGEYKN